MEAIASAAQAQEEQTGQAEGESLRLSRHDADGGEM
jgi:hypothetical protein